MVKKRSLIWFLTNRIGFNRADHEDSLQGWRQYTFRLMLNVSIIVGLFAYLAELATAIPNQAWGKVLISTFSIVVGILSVRYLIAEKYYYPRVIITLVVLYVLGIYFSATTLTVGDGRIWLLFMSILAALFLGIHAGITAVSISTISWFVLGFLFQQGILQHPQARLEGMIRADNFGLWFNTGMISASVGFILIAAVTSFNQNLSKSLQKSRSLEEKYRLLVDNCPDLIMEIDLDLQILACNPAMARSLGYTNKDLVGMNLRSLLPEKSLSKRIEIAEKALAQNKPIDFKDQFNGKHLYTVFIPNLERETVQVVAHDITEQEIAQAELLKHKEHLEALVDKRSIKLKREMAERERAEKMAMAAQKLADLGLLTTGIAHELNSPLQGIQSISDYMLMALERAGLDPAFLQEQKEQIEIVQENVSRCAKIVHSLRFYAHPPQDQYSEQYINDLINRTLVLAKHQFDDDNISIVTHLDSSIPPLICSRDQIMQVLINLMTNACDAMPDGGEIKIETTYRAERQQVEIKVTDTGQGIPSEHLDQIEKPFFTTKPVGKGTGLGLFITSNIVRAHGGEINYESAPEEGTVVTVSLAKEPPEDSPSPSLYGRYAEYI
jgi:PAS domain S-box-containing protein